MQKGEVLRFRCVYSPDVTFTVGAESKENYNVWFDVQKKFPKNSQGWFKWMLFVTMNHTMLAHYSNILILNKGILLPIIQNFN